MMKKFFTFLLMVAAVTLAGCKDDKTTTDPGAEDVPVLEIVGSADMQAAAAEGTYTISYTVTNPVEDEWADATADQTWVNSFDNSEPGQIAFLVETNPDAGRSAVITVTYPGAKSRQVTLTQAAAEPKPDVPATEVTLTTDIDGWPKTYGQGVAQIGEHNFMLSNVADYGNGIQFKRSSGYLANADDMGVVRSIEIVYAGNSPKTDLTLCLGDTPTPAGDGMTAVRSGDTYTFDCSAFSYSYFTLGDGSGACFVESIKINCGGEGGGGTLPDPTDEEPVFGTPSYSELTKNSATIACAYSYAGKGTVSEVYFLYGASGDAEQRVNVSSPQAGDKSAQLSGLTPSTLYSFRLCVVVDGKTYTSGSGSLVTYDDSGKPSTDARYTGWAELPTEDASKLNSEYYYAYHLCPDYPAKGTKARNFTTCYSKSYKCPVWVAAPLHDCYTGDVKRTNSYRSDPDIKCTQVGHWGGYTRGHMLGSNERRVTTAVNRDVFYYSNIGPQLQTYFNTGGGQWNTAEDWVDKQWRGRADTCYQVVGTYWEDTKKVVDGTTIPTHYYTVLLKAKKSAGRKWVVNCSREELQTIAIMVRHKTYSKGEVVKPDQFESKGVFKSVAEIERLTGHTFFANVPNAPKESFATSDWNF